MPERPPAAMPAAAMPELGSAQRPQNDCDYSNEGKNDRNNSISKDSLQTMKKIYDLKLDNVEYGTVNCNSITIIRVGSRLKDAIRARMLSSKYVYEQVELGIKQLHANGFAHCDIYFDNVFVDSIEDGGKVFIGDLEYCRPKEAPAPRNIRRSDTRARTAEDLDVIQLGIFKDDLGKFCR